MRDSAEKEQLKKYQLYYLPALGALLPDAEEVVDVFLDV
jgi:hypothetical protein